MKRITTCPGFENPVHDTQKNFRAILQAMSRPCLPVPFPVLLPSIPYDGSAPDTAMGTAGQGLLSVALTLCDSNTPIWLDRHLDTAEVRHHLRFHCSSPLTETPQEAAFAFIASPHDMPRLHNFAPGEAAYPERSTTLVIAVQACGETKPPVVNAEIRGPGIRETKAGAGGGKSVENLEHSRVISSLLCQMPDWFFQDWRHNHEIYPLGVDVLFVRTTADSSGFHTCLLGLPRSSSIHYSA